MYFQCNVIRQIIDIRRTKSSYKFKEWMLYIEMDGSNCALRNELQSSILLSLVNDNLISCRSVIKRTVTDKSFNEYSH